MKDCRKCTPRENRVDVVVANENVVLESLMIDVAVSFEWLKLSENNGTPRNMHETNRSSSAKLLKRWKKCLRKRKDSNNHMDELHDVTGRRDQVQWIIKQLNLIQN